MKYLDDIPDVPTSEAWAKLEARVWAHGVLYLGYDALHRKALRWHGKATRKQRRLAAQLKRKQQS